ncbi:DUF2505 domain-containing protein [Schaalia sp. Marseille-Q2122]|uniref:DUF2505 domain-containing protein n=1 Tax=Schaalia sp. Marseille-Q2122 TaxID=2736604 RepID=UPI00158A2604|nr:DUF2505 domain-containing protein [Schaalia sp. Marseille-Q2122]
MRFEHTITYPAPIAAVEKMLTNVDYTRGRFAAARVNAQVEADRANPRAIVSRVPVDATLLPEPANRFVPSDTVITLTETWEMASDQTLSGEGVGDFPGLPIRMSSQSLCVEDDGVTRRTITGELTVSIPFLGGRIEQKLEEQMALFARKEEEFAERWLEQAE